MIKISLRTQSAIQQLTKLNNSEQPNCLTELKMDPLAESMTVNNINTNKHVNLVQVKKIKAENSSSATISLDIIAGKCDYGRIWVLEYVFAFSTMKSFDFSQPQRQSKSKL